MYSASSTALCTTAPTAALYATPFAPATPLALIDGFLGAFPYLALIPLLWPWSPAGVVLGGAWPWRKPTSFGGTSSAPIIRTPHWLALLCTIFGHYHPRAAFEASSERQDRLWRYFCLLRPPSTVVVEVADLEYDSS